MGATAETNRALGLPTGTSAELRVIPFTTKYWPLGPAATGQQIYIVPRKDPTLGEPENFGFISAAFFTYKL